MLFLFTDDNTSKERREPTTNTQGSIFKGRKGTINYCKKYPLRQTSKLRLVTNRQHAITADE